MTTEFLSTLVHLWQAARFSVADLALAVLGVLALMGVVSWVSRWRQNGLHNFQEKPLSSKTILTERRSLEMILSVSARMNKIGRAHV